MEKLRLSIALDEYDHTRDVMSGRVPVEGVELIAMNLQIEEIFYRTTFYQEWDVSELSMGKYCSLRSQGDETLTAIPVFVSRQFRHSMSACRVAAIFATALYSECGADSRRRCRDCRLAGLDSARRPLVSCNLSVWLN